MQDRFKFRVFNKKQNKLYSWEDLTKTKEDNTLYWCMIQVQNDFENNILMQCTGLKDKNGNLIYEGDIVKFYFDRDKIIGVITWDNEHQVGFYVNTTDYFKDKYITNYDFLCGFKYEVIGNIYENKELLND